MTLNWRNESQANLPNVEGFLFENGKKKWPLFRHLDLSRSDVFPALPWRFASLNAGTIDHESLYWFQCESKRYEIFQ